MSPGAGPTIASLLLARAGDPAPALRLDDDVWSWDQHVRASAVRASWLLANRDAGPFHVGVLLDNVPEFSFLLGAAALAGATVVALNPTRTAVQLARDLAATDCRLVLTQQRHLRLLDAAGLDDDRVWSVDRGDWRDALQPHRGSPPPAEAAAPEDLFCLIFTSGTGGDPKAVRCSQGRTAVRGAGHAARWGLRASDTFYVAMPLFHSNALIAGWVPAVALGACVALRPRFSASAFMDDVRRYGATYANYVGKPLSYVLAQPERPRDADNPLRLVFGNEASDRDIACFSRRFGCQVIDGFGSTEGGVSIFRDEHTPPGSLGRAVGDVRVLDPGTGAECAAAAFGPDGRLANPDEAVGELVNVGGAGSFEGYYAAGADAERLRDGAYWSGDLGYRDTDGYLYFAGRAADRLRVDGENLSTAAIERVLSRHPAVQVAVVYAVPDPAVGDQVMAALLLPGGRTLDPAAFGQWLAGQPDLSRKEWPRYVRLTRSLPQTPTYKVLVRALREEGRHCADPVWERPGPEPHYRLVIDLEAGMR